MNNSNNPQRVTSQDDDDDDDDDTLLAANIHVNMSTPADDDTLLAADIHVNMSTPADDRMTDDELHAKLSEQVDWLFRASQSFPDILHVFLMSSGTSQLDHLPSALKLPSCAH